MSTLNWADLSEDDSTTDIKKTETEQGEDGNAEVVLANERLKKLGLEKEKIEEVGEGSASLTTGKISVISATGEKSVYEATSSFEDLNLDAKLLKAIYEMGFVKPSLIQAAALPKILAGSNIIAQAHHGSGKTATFALSMLSKVDISLRAPQAICLCNTRELAIQIMEVVLKLGKYLNVSCFMAVKGVRAAKINSHIIVGTPGGVLNQITNFNTSNIKIVVFDEADVLVNENDKGRANTRGGRGGRGGAAAGGRVDGLVQQAAAVRKSCPKAQILLFSATFADEVLGFAKNIAPNAERITLEKDKLALDNILQCTLDCTSAEDKYEQLAQIYESIDTKQSIIFCNTTNAVKSLCNRLRHDGFKVSLIYGSMENDERLTAIKDFRDGKTKVLIATNLISRGLDVPAVSLVINYDIPIKMSQGKAISDCDTYMHRIGRSGRFGRSACSINLTHDDETRAHVKAIENEYSHPTMKIQRDDIDTLEKIVLAAYEGKILTPEELKK